MAYYNKMGADKGILVCEPFADSLLSNYIPTIVTHFDLYISQISPQYTEELAC